MPNPILIIEDDEVARAGLCSLLKADGYETVAAANGREALARLDAGLQPAMILLDMILPECDGWQFCAQQKDSPAAAVPIAIMTGLGIASDEWARSMGAVILLRKPLDLEQLLATVRRLVHVQSEKGGPA